ncbi:MAG: PDZ domain-containing protein [Thermoanaerobaculia bacterium]|nr:PDZ domain-containing protein [Thermoanaerobaculia bacterium]
MRSNRSRAVFIVCSLAALASLRAVAGPQGSGRDPASRALSIFSDVLALTRANYVESTDPRILLEGAYDGMSDALDPFSFYVPASERATFQAQQASGAVNPGIVIARRGGFPYVVAPLPGSPAEKAGVQAGDLLDSVDGKSMRNAPLWKITAALEGPEGTRVDVGLFRVVDEKKVSFRLQRSKYEAAAPTAKWESDVGVIRVPAFGASTAAAVRKLVDEANRRGLSRLVVDVRGAIGGDPAEAAGPASLFVDRGVVAKVVARKAAAKPLDTIGERAWRGRTVVLIDDATGGPAEVFAAALRDRGSAPTVGEGTVGMAFVQRLVPTPSGGSLFMTVARYVSPSGAVLGGKGLSPDERVIVFPGDQDGKDPILERGLEVARRETPARRAA